MREEDYKNVKATILARFSQEFRDLYIYDSTANAVVETLINGGNVYDLLSQIVVNQSEMTKKMIEFYQLFPTPRIMVVKEGEFNSIKESFNQLKNTNKYDNDKIYRGQQRKAEGSRK